MFIQEKRIKFSGYPEKKVMTVLGSIRIKRAYYYDVKGKRGYVPKDKELDIEGTSFSLGVRRMMGRVGAYRSFALGQIDLKELAGISVTVKEIERYSEQLGHEMELFFDKDSTYAISTENIISIKKIPIMYVSMDGTGVPVVKEETKNRVGKGKNGESKTREAKLGCVFTQTGVDKNGYPLRKESSTTYIGAIETSEEFSGRIYGEAMRRGMTAASKVCVLGDGARWIWNISGEQFSGAIEIVDLYHAREHYWNVAKVAFEGESPKKKQWTDQRRKELDQGNVEGVIKAIRLLSGTMEQQELFHKEANYFDNNKERMRYKNFRNQGLFLGSGVMEAGCRTIVGQGLKQSGMHWTVQGANGIITLRCGFISNRWEDFWESRAAT